MSSLQVPGEGGNYGGRSRSSSGKMEWSEQKDILLCHEVLQAEPYRAKEKTVGRAQAWEKIANILNKRAEFKVNKRSVRDHYMVLVEKLKNKRLHNS